MRTLQGAEVQPSCPVGNYSGFGGTVPKYGSSARFDHHLLDGIQT